MARYRWLPGCDRSENSFARSTAHRFNHRAELAEFVVRASCDEMSSAARQQLKIRILHALSCALGHPGLGGERLELAIEFGDTFLERLDVRDESSCFGSQALQVQPFLPMPALV